MRKSSLSLSFKRNSKSAINGIICLFTLFSWNYSISGSENALPKEHTISYQDIKNARSYYSIDVNSTTLGEYYEKLCSLSVKLEECITKYANKNNHKAFVSTVDRVDYLARELLLELDLSKPALGLFTHKGQSLLDLVESFNALNIDLFTLDFYDPTKPSPVSVYNPETKKNHNSTPDKIPFFRILVNPQFLKSHNGFNESILDHVEKSFPIITEKAEAVINSYVESKLILNINQGRKNQGHKNNAMYYTMLQVLFLDQQFMTFAKENLIIGNFDPRLKVEFTYGNVFELEKPLLQTISNNSWFHGWENPRNLYQIDLNSSNSDSIQNYIEYLDTLYADMLAIPLSKFDLDFLLKYTSEKNGHLAKTSKVECYRISKHSGLAQFLVFTDEQNYAYLINPADEYDSITKKEIEKVVNSLFEVFELANIDIEDFSESLIESRKNYFWDFSFSAGRNKYIAKLAIADLWNVLHDVLNSEDNEFSSSILTEVVSLRQNFHKVFESNLSPNQSEKWTAFVKSVIAGFNNGKSLTESLLSAEDSYKVFQRERDIDEYYKHAVYETTLDDFASASHEQVSLLYALFLKGSPNADPASLRESASQICGPNYKIMDKLLSRIAGKVKESETTIDYLSYVNELIPQLYEEVLNDEKVALAKKQKKLEEYQKTYKTCGKCNGRTWLWGRNGQVVQDNSRQILLLTIDESRHFSKMTCPGCNGEGIIKR